MKLIAIIGSVLFMSVAGLQAQEVQKKKVVKKTVTTYEEVDADAAPAQKRTQEVAAPEENRTTTSNSHIDVFAGMAKPTGSEVGTMLKARFGYGAQLLFGATPDFSIGAFYTTNNGEFKDESLAEFRFSYYGLVAQYKLTPTFFMQGRLGLSSLEATVDQANVTIKSDKHPVIAGLGFGVDLPISESFSFAPFASYTRSFKAGSGDDEVEGYGMIELMAALRFNF